MSKTIAVSLVTLAAGVILATAPAQQNPPAKAQSAQTLDAASQQAPAAAKKPSSSVTKSTRPHSAQAPLTLKTERDKVSYALGVNIGKGLHRDAVDLDPAIIARGLRDAITNGKTLLTDDEVRATLTAFQNEMRQKQQAKMMELDQANKKAGQEFLNANKAKDGVIALPSGLQYKVLQQGTGPKPTPNDLVVCNYRGTLLDGTEFDSSYKRGQPATFPVNGVIKGWSEALQIMPVGSKWQLFIPSDLAYGDRGAGAQIGPGATLVFEVELLSIKSKETPAPPQPAPPPSSQPQKPQL